MIAYLTETRYVWIKEDIADDVMLFLDKFYGKYKYNYNYQGYLSTIGNGHYLEFKNVIIARKVQKILEKEGFITLYKKEKYRKRIPIKQFKN